ncbi:BLUF domain-containing protein [Rubrivirga sp. S365]|uniref:BLUF domain-containing protein n=1 Tax=Rubrivirga litoralis TaxID=3075598 RepID=A0ABU3BNL6_9BACT|nr:MULTISPECIES: BLUF domain-containing protein [unclassified Rubrivirga]MDT0630858.1 BLUF domain-containing protein [Rubrivirga sp. F394]MDT7857410.1 BLUF domain-containing protein [Rubrivirga sp. S365]
MPTYALLYRSRSVSTLSDADVAQIAWTSVHRNARVDVTGLLLHADVAGGAEILFVQWLEGPKDDVLALYARIRRDPRHTDCETIAEGAAADLVGRDGRLFPEWGMRFEPVGALPMTLEAFLADWLGRGGAMPPPAPFAGYRRRTTWK